RWLARPWLHQTFFALQSFRPIRQVFPLFRSRRNPFPSCEQHQWAYFSRSGSGLRNQGSALCAASPWDPELAYGWRKVMLPLASAGFHVIAPDMRGYGRTTGWDDSYDGDVFQFRHTNLVRDALGLVSAFGYRTAAVVGRDAGSPVAAYCAVIRPDVFRAVAMMTSPFAGPPALPFDTMDGAAQPQQAPAGRSINDELAK